jgi:hypothetical protein
LCRYTPELLGKDWWDWPEDLRRRDPAALEVGLHSLPGGVRLVAMDPMLAVID